MSRGSRSREADYGRDERRPRLGGSSSIESRVYIGNLNVKNFSYREINDWMDKYGKVIDVNFCDRFILVQFDRESDARRAVDREKGQSFRGSRFDIRMAHSSDGSTSNSSRLELPRSRSPRALPYERAPREISPGYRDSGRDRSPIDRERYYKAERRGNSPEQRVYERPRMIEEERPRMIEEERPRSNIHPEYPVVEYQEPNWNAPPLTNKVTAERPGFDAAIIVMSSDLLGYAETIEAKLQRQIALTTHIIVLKEESHANACIEDLNNKAVLYAFLVNHMNQKHLSCTLRILYGSGQEHRNMLLNNALSFVARNFEDYQKRVRELKSIAPKPNYDPSRMPPGFLAPDDKTIYQLHLLADSRMLTIDELNEVDQFIQKRIQILAQAEGILEKPSNTLSMLSNEAIQNNPSKIIAAGNPNIRDEKALIAQQNQLHSKILNILKPATLTTNNTVPDNKDVNNSSLDQFSGYNESSLSSTTGNNPLTNPKVQQALDSLMQSKFRPNLPEQQTEDNSTTVRGFQSSNTSSQVTPNQPPSNQYNTNASNMNPTNMSAMNSMNPMNPIANNMNAMNSNQMNLINANMNRLPNPMANAAAMRGIAPSHNYQPNFQGYFQQPPVGQPMYRPRQPFQPRPQYPGY